MEPTQLCSRPLTICYHRPIVHEHESPKASDWSLKQCVRPDRAKLAMWGARPAVRSLGYEASASHVLLHLRSHGFGYQSTESAEKLQTTP